MLFLVELSAIYGVLLNTTIRIRDAQRRCLTATESGTDSNSENYSATSISRESGEGRSGGAMRVGDLVILVVLFGEILKDAAGLEEAYLLSVAEGICDGWNASIGVDLEEPGLLLGVFANIDMLDFCMAGQQHQHAWLSIEEW